MKLLIVNPFGVGTYDDPILNSVRQVVRKDTEVSVMHLKKGLSFIRHAYFQMLLLPDVVETIIQAEKEGFDGVTVACAFDPGVKEAKEVVSIPVVGQASAGVSIARMLGQKFGVITDAKRAVVGMTDLFRTHHLDVDMVGIVSVDMNVEDMEKDKFRIREKIYCLARDLVSKGADSIVIGCSVLSAYSFGMDIPEDLKGIPFIDCNIAAIKTLEMMVDLHKTCYIEPSRHICYQKPQIINKKDFDFARNVYNV